MIIKERKKPLKVLKLEALQRRLLPTHSKLRYIDAELGKALAGWRGEQAIDYYLSFLAKERYLIIQDLRLEDCEGRFFQIDNLLLSQRGHIVMDVKNMAGTLYFNDTPQQLIQTLNAEKKAYSCPILQVERQCSQLQTFLKKLRIPEAPIIPLIVISHSNTVMTFSETFKKAKQCVIHAAFLPNKVGGIETTLKEDLLTEKELKKACRLLIKHDQPLNTDYLEKFSISQSDLITGVQCPICHQFPMQRQHGKWFCLACHHSSKDAHLSALQDYFLLLDSKITNQQLRNFLHIPSISVASKLLSSIDLKKLGKKKGRCYLNEDT